MVPRTPLDTLLDQVADIATRPLTEAVTLPPEMYGRQDVYELEVERIFRTDWMCVGRTDEVPNVGDYRAVDLCEEPLVMVRDQANVVRVLSRICRHRWVEVVEGTGTAKHLQCPYHHWTYSLSGELVSAPEMADNRAFDKASCSLPQIRTETWLGFVFVNLDGKADPLAPRLAELTQLLEPYQLERQRTVRATPWGHSPYDWKLLIDNYLECYHHAGIHHGSVQPLLPARLTYTETRGGDHWSLAHLPVAASAVEPDRLGRKSMPTLLPAASSLTETQLNEVLIIGIFPAMIFGVSPDFIEWYHLFPLGPGQIELTIKFVIHPEGLASPIVNHGLAGIVDCLDVIHGEDLGVLESMQRGVQSRLATTGPMSHLEETTQQFNRYVARKLCA